MTLNINLTLNPAGHATGSQDGVNRSEWYSYNPMSSVTTLATSGSDGGSTFGGVDQSCGDLVLMASPIRGEASSCFCLLVFFAFFFFLTVHCLFVSFKSSTLDLQSPNRDVGMPHGAHVPMDGPIK